MFGARVFTYTTECTCKTIGMHRKMRTHMLPHTGAVLSEVLQALQVFVPLCVRACEWVCVW